MKRPYVSILAAALVPLSVDPTFGQDLSVGVRAGYGITDFESSVVDYESRGNFSFSGVAEYGLATWVAVLPELQFVVKGSSTQVQVQVPGSDPPQLTTTDLDIEINYLELILPVALRLPISGGAIAPRIFAGPALALKLNCTVSSRLDGLAFRSSCASEFPEGSGTPLLDSSTFDFGVAVGGGLAVVAGPGAVTADVRFTQGLTRVDSDDDATPEIMNQSVQFLLGYIILLTER